MNARISDHSAWAARGYWKAAYEYLLEDTRDLPQTDAQIMAHPKVQALVDALKYIYDNGDGYDGRSMAREALAAMEPPHEP